MFSGIMGKILGQDYEYYEDNEETEYEEDDQPAGNSKTNGAYSSHIQPVQRNISSIPGGKVSHLQSERIEILNFDLDDYELTGNVCKHIKTRKPIVVNMNKLNAEQRQRALDYLTGATRALNGSISRVAENIFIFAPENVVVNADKLRNKQPASNWNENASWDGEEV